jgi:hypothetical protein
VKWVYLAGWVAFVALAVVLLRDGHPIYACFALGASTHPLQLATWRAIRDSGYNPTVDPPPPDAKREGGGLHDPVTKETWIAFGVIVGGLVVSAALGVAHVLPSDAPGMFLAGLAVLLLAYRQMFLLACFGLACRKPRRSNPIP